MLIGNFHIHNTARLVKQKYTTEQDLSNKNTIEKMETIIGGRTFFVRKNGQRGGEDAGVASSKAIGRVGGRRRWRRDSPWAAAVTWRRLLPLLHRKRHSETCHKKAEA